MDTFQLLVVFGGIFVVLLIVKLFGEIVALRSDIAALRGEIRSLQEKE